MARQIRVTFHAADWPRPDNQDSAPPCTDEVARCTGRARHTRHELRAALFDSICALVWNVEYPAACALRTDKRKAHTPQSTLCGCAMLCAESSESAGCGP